MHSFSVMTDMDELTFVRRGLRDQWPARNPLTKNGSNVGLEQFQATTVLTLRHTVEVCTEVYHFTAEQNSHRRR